MNRCFDAAGFRNNIEAPAVRHGRAQVDARIETAKNTQKIPLGIRERKSAGVVHRDRHPQIYEATRLDSRERFLGNADELSSRFSPNVNVLPTTEGSPPNRRLQNEWLTTATG